MWCEHINIHRNLGVDIVSEFISYLSDIFKRVTIFCRKNFFKQVSESYLISGEFPFDSYEEPGRCVFCAHICPVFYLIYIEGCEPLMSDPSGTKMTTEYY